MSIARPGILTGITHAATAETKERPINADVPVEYPAQKPRTYIRTGIPFMRIIPLPYEKPGSEDTPSADPDEIVITLHPGAK